MKHIILTTILIFMTFLSFGQDKNNKKDKTPKINEKYGKFFNYRKKEYFLIESVVIGHGNKNKKCYGYLQITFENNIKVSFMVIDANKSINGDFHWDVLCVNDKQKYKMVLPTHKSRIFFLHEDEGLVWLFEKFRDVENEHPQASNKVFYSMEFFDLTYNEERR